MATGAVGRLPVEWAGEETRSSWGWPWCWRAVSAKKVVMHCRALSVWVTRAASSVKRRSHISLSWVLVWAWRRHRLNRLPCRKYWCTPPPRHPGLQWPAWASCWRRCRRELVAGHNPASRHWRWGRAQTGRCWVWSGQVALHAAGSPSRGTWGDSWAALGSARDLSCWWCQGFVRSTNVAYSPLFCLQHFSFNCQRTNTMSIVPLFALKPN